MVEIIKSRVLNIFSLLRRLITVFVALGIQLVSLHAAELPVGTVATNTVRAVESPYHMRDLHTTLLRLMGLDDMRLTFYFTGRNYRFTENGGELIPEALA